MTVFSHQVPNKTLQYRILKRWAAFDVPRDLYYFGPQIWVCEKLDLR
jgi:hypothetical protein